MFETLWFLLCMVVGGHWICKWLDGDLNEETKNGKTGVADRSTDELP